MRKHDRFAAHNFTGLTDLEFIPSEYSMLKFGSDSIARKYGYELAAKFFAAYSSLLLSNPCVVIPSPYNHVENAATIMTKHFINKINMLLTEANGEHVEYSIIHRKVTYTNDYGFLSKEKRKDLIDKDTFYFNRQFVEGKTLIFIDDVRITGSHEEKVISVMEDESLTNQAIFLYYGQYFGNSPDIEAQLNFSYVQEPRLYLSLVLQGKCHVIVRTIKYLLSLPMLEAAEVVAQLPIDIREQIYHGSLGEGYYKIPAYQKNFDLIKNSI